MAERVMAERAAAAATKRPERRLFLGGWPRRFIKEQPLGAFGGIVLLALVLVSIFAGFLAGHDPNQMTLADRLQGPSGEYPLGTDQLGRDYLSRLIYGARISLFVGLAATTLHVVVAVLIGGSAGFIGGKLDLLVQRFVDAWMSFPGLLLLLTIMSIAGQGLLQIIVILGVSSGISNSRVVRGAVIGIKENDYFQAAEAIGERTTRTLLRHVLPNIMAPIIVIFSITIGSIIVAEASLSFLGFGLPPGRSELGRNAEPGRPPVHGDGAAAGDLAGPVPDDCRVQHQHVRRRPARPARPEATRQRRPPLTADRSADGWLGRPLRPDSSDLQLHPESLGGAAHKRHLRRNTGCACRNLDTAKRNSPVGVTKSTTGRSDHGSVLRMKASS